MELPKKEQVVFFKNLLKKENQEYFIKKAPKLGKGEYSWKERTINITDDPIVKEISDFLKNNFTYDFVIEEAQIQNWNEGSSSGLHIHNDLGRQKTKYNSLIYLNDNYEGGEFFTKEGIEIKPEAGMLTLFDGQETWHGVKEVKNNDRFTLIFWWKNTGDTDITQ